MTPHDARTEAVAWLAGRLRFERLLQDLHARADGHVDEREPAAPAKAA